jgi:AraC-like DNA-binding protein
VAQHDSPQEALAEAGRGEARPGPEDARRRPEAANPQPDAAPYQWLSTPRWYLWEGGFLVIANARGVVPPHAHHAIQIAVSVERPMLIRGARGDWRATRGMIVQPNVQHSFDCHGAAGAMLFVDPESSEGSWLCSGLRQDITLVPDARLSSPVSELRTFLEHPFESLEVGALIRHIVQALSPGPAPARRLDERVTRVLDAIRRSDDLRISLTDAADLACLSPSRFTHLFRQQMGLPFSRYMLWRKLTRAMVAISAARTIADAAHAADFADAAHLTRTFYQMVGMAPSVLMQGEFARIASPFSALGSAG